MAFPVSMFMGLINAQTHYMQISDTDLHPNWTTNPESIGQEFIYALTYDSHCVDFHDAVMW